MAPKVSIVTAFPECCNLHCLCYKCGLKDFPNWQSEWWCEGLCCCLFQNVGLKELMTTQYCCLGPCELTSPAFKLTTSFPDFCVINCLLWKNGCQMPPDFMKEDFVVNKWCCCHSECGLKEAFSKCQWYCIKIETGLKIGPA